ncbi:MAG: hypothetical protein ACRDKA_00060 [Actinomycetota bacterium]
MPPGLRTRRAALGLALACSLALSLPAVPVSARERLIPYRGVGGWIDIYDDRAWERPVRTMAQLQRRGVRTIYLQTCHFNCDQALFRPARMAELLRAAQRRRMRVVSWYLPGFVRPKRDLQRSLAAIRFRTRDGRRFDSFALDVEAMDVARVGIRNRRLVALSQRLRTRVGLRYGMGAITPPWFFSWRPFPYRALARHYDVFLPMNYFTVRGRGPAVARVHTRRNIKLIRRQTGDPAFPIHDIGGLAEDLGGREVRAVVRTDRRHGVIGTSLYDAFTSAPSAWRQLRGRSR